jgi:RNA polymerase sigma-70 factor, ECF subfamily
MEIEQTVLDDLFSATYEELRRLATRVGRDDPSQTLNPTALVNEAYLKLAASRPSAFASPLHFKRIAARAMRQVLVEAARKRSSLKRGAGEALVTLDEGRGGEAIATDPEEVLRLNEALDGLAKLNPRQASLIEYRFFGGFDVEETAELLEVSASTLLRDWRAARAWLAVELRHAG